VLEVYAAEILLVCHIFSCVSLQGKISFANGVILNAHRYKAMATSVIGPDSNGAIRKMIQNTIDRLQKSSIRTDDLGNRYSRMLRLLWRKPPHSKDVGADPPSQSRTPPPATPVHSITQEGPLLPQQQHQQLQQELQQQPDPELVPRTGSSSDQVWLGGFSWRDLDAVGQFATNNNSVDNVSLLSGSGSGSGGFAAEAEDPFAYLENQGQTWYDFGLSPSNVIF